MMLTQTGNIGARLDRLPATRSIWVLVGLLSLGGFFEFYDLFFTGYVAPGLMREHILTPTTPGLFGTTGIAGFIAALFSGLFVGTMAFRLRRRPLRPPHHLHLLPALVQRRLRHHGAAD